MKRRDHIKDLYSSPAPEQLAMANSRVPAGPVKTMGLALGRMETESRALREALTSGGSVVELDPSLIEASFIRDRLPEDDFESFQRSIAENGQEVPILVRPHPEMEGRFQIAFGHRRHRACSALGIKVKAVVREMDDRQLVVAQGVENAQRRDLSYIERALYATRLEDRGFERTVICEALATEKGELSKLISVAREVPEDVIAAIGPAPKAGRRRWLGLAEAMSSRAAIKAVGKAILDPNLERADSDTRFLRVLAAASGPKETPKTTVWKSQGQKAATLTRTGKSANLAFHAEPDFAEFVAAKLDDLYESFRNQQGEH